MSKIEDQFSAIPDNGARYYYRCVAKGVCVNCGKKRKLVTKTRCKACRDYKRAHYLRTRKLKGYPKTRKPRASKFQPFVGIIQSPVQ